ncbi:thioredoxin domain-containing protein [Gordonia sp. VNK1]|uniref:DsbA family protein n=1 Tax=Gordonia oleivorans TaxID=3156618 RepID=UPI0032B61573
MADKRRKPVVDPRAAERRRSLFMRIGAVVAIIVVAAVVAVSILWSNGKIFSDDSSVAAGTPPTVTTDGAFRITTAPAGTTPKAVVEILEDFQCPVCKQFESVFGDALTQLKSNPNVAIDYRPVAILDRMSSTNYSTRAANASACVAESTGGANNFEVWLKFHSLLYENQPAENGSGLTDDQLASYATEAGAQNVKECITRGDYEDWVTQETKDSGVTGTPTVKINGQDFNIQQGPEAFVAAVNAAAGSQQ